MELTEKQIKQIISEEISSSLNENQMSEDLGTFGGAVKNGLLKPNFKVENATMDVYNGRPCLKCHMGRWLGSDDNIILFPDGTGINTDEKARNDKEFRWSSVEVRTTSFAKSILIGAGIGAATGAAVGAVGPSALRGAKALAGRVGVKGAQAAGTQAVKKGGSSTIRKIGSNLLQFGIPTPSGNMNPQTKRTLVGAGIGAAGLGAGGYGLYKAGQNSNNLQEEEINELHPALIGGAAGLVAGAIGGGIHGLIKNRNNVVYYSNGTYRSKQGDIEGRWDNISGTQALDGQQDKTNKSIDKRILALQQALKAAGYNPGPADGIRGPKTEAACREAGIDINAWKPGMTIIARGHQLQKLQPEIKPIAVNPVSPENLNIPGTISKNQQTINASPKSQNDIEALQAQRDMIKQNINNYHGKQRMNLNKRSRELKKQIRQQEKQNRNMNAQISESEIKRMIKEEIINSINEGEANEWFDLSRAVGRGIKNRISNAAQTGREMWNAAQQGNLTGAAASLGAGMSRSVKNSIDNTGHFVGDVAQNYRDVYNAGKKAVQGIQKAAQGAAGAFTGGLQKGLTRNQKQQATVQPTQTATPKQAQTPTIQQVYKDIATLQPGKEGWLVKARQAGWDENKINQYRQIINVNARQKAAQTATPKVQQPVAQQPVQAIQPQQQGLQVAQGPSASQVLQNMPQIAESKLNSLIEQTIKEVLKDKK